LTLNIFIIKATVLGHVVVNIQKQNMWQGQTAFPQQHGTSPFTLSSEQTPLYRNAEEKRAGEREGEPGWHQKYNLVCRYLI